MHAGAINACGGQRPLTRPEQRSAPHPLSDTPRRQEVIRLTFPDCSVIRLSPDATELVLFCPRFNVILTGRGLRALADAIDAQACVWVQEFDPRR